MAAGNGVNEFGGQLRRWRQARRLSQLQLAVDAGVSPRHLSFIETGRSQPSREMVLLLGDQLRLPLREQNAMLLAAGFAPAFEQRALDSSEMSTVRDSVEMVLKSHEPFPAIAVDRKWNVVMINCGAPILAEGVSPELLGGAANVYRLSLHPNGFRPRVLNFAEYARHMVARLRHDAAVSGDSELAELLKEVESYPGMRSIAGASANRGGVALPLRIKSAVGELSAGGGAPRSSRKVRYDNNAYITVVGFVQLTDPIELKKQIVRSIVEEILVDEKPPGRLSFIVHWRGGSHTAFEIEKTGPRTVSRTHEADLDVIRKMAIRYGDDTIAQVLNKLGRRTGKGNRWSQLAVKTARRNHGIAGHTRTFEDPEVLTLQGAARCTDTSDTTIKKLVDGGILPMRQVVPFAPWEIQRADLGSERVRAVLARLKQTGRVVVGDTSEAQSKLFP